MHLTAKNAPPYLERCLHAYDRSHCVNYLDPPITMNVRVSGTEQGEVKFICTRGIVVWLAFGEEGGVEGALGVLTSCMG